MKKVFGTMFLALLILPFKVNAEVTTDDLIKIHDEISKDNKIIINSIPFKYLVEEEEINKCVAEEEEYFNSNNDEAIENGEEPIELTDEIRSGFRTDCNNKYYDWYVNSTLDGVRRDLEDTGYQLSTDCNYETNTCKVVISYEEETENDTVSISEEEEYEIVFTGTYNEEIDKQTDKILNQFASSYSAMDLEFINMTFNYKSWIDFLDDTMYDQEQVLKLFPEAKEIIENNPNYAFKYISNGGGSGPFGYGHEGYVYVVDENGNYVNRKSIGFGVSSFIFIPDTTADNDSARIKAAEDRIKKYLNDSSIDINISFNEKDTIGACYEPIYDEETGEEIDYIPADCEVNIDGKTYATKIYTLTINGNSHRMSIVEVPKSKIKGSVTVKSKDYRSNIRIESKGANVPLDTSVNTKEVTDELDLNGVHRAWDIDLYSGLNEKYITKIPDGVIVRLPLGDDYKPNSVDIYHINEDGTVGEKYDAEIEIIDGKKYAVFKTNHFSTYAITESNDVKVPETYDGISTYLLMLVLGSIAVVGISVFNKKRICQ